MKSLSEANLLNHLPGALVIDMTGVIIYMNDQCASYLCVDKHKSIGQTIKDVFPETKMMESLRIDKPEIIFYNSTKGIGISIHVPIFEKGKKVALLEYDVAQSSEVLYELADEYTLFLDEELKYLKNEIVRLRNTKYSIDTIIGKSNKIMLLKEQIKTAASTSSTVIIQGETGTGKELVAHAIHQMSRRSSRNFIKINAASLPESLAESELFGYEGGSFTGADRKGKKGKFELANHGTLFIDEINQMPESLQPKLLRVLQEREIDRIGGEKSIPIDVRIIAATNEDLKKLVSQGRFREDLYYRLNVIQIITPPLREHLDDIPVLVTDFVNHFNYTMNRKITQIDNEIYPAMYNYHWPGNVRELQNIIERAMNQVGGHALSVRDFDFLPSSVYSEIDKLLGGMEVNQPIEEVKRKAESALIIKVLEMFHGNKTQAANYLNISRPLLYQKMKRLEIKI